MEYHVILDTDIGDDVDDAIALALALKMPQIVTKGVITTYRNAKMRTKIAMALLDGWKRTDIPVYAGEDDPEREKYYNFPFEKQDADGKPIIGHYEEYMRGYACAEGDWQEFLAHQIRSDPNGISLIGIGPLTDIAKFADSHPEEFSLLKEIVIMGGDFAQRKPEWNIKCDPEAAQRVFSSGQRIRLIPVNITIQCVFSAEQVQRLNNECIGNQRLSRMIGIWIKNTHYKKLPILHDPLALTCVCMDFCSFSKKTVRVGLEGGERGVTLEDGAGSEILVADSVRAAEAAEFICNTLCDLRTGGERC